MSDAYASLAGMLSGADEKGAQGAGGWLFGEVKKAGGGTLEVVCGGLTLAQDELFVPPELDYSWTVDNGENRLLRRGDLLFVLVTADRQDYYILKKAVFQ